MSTLRTNALEGVDAKNSITIVAGAGNITTTNVQDGLAKQTIQYSGSDNTIQGSTNTSSVTDNGTGNFTVNYTNNFASVGTQSSHTMQYSLLYGSRFSFAHPSLSHKCVP